MADVPAWIKESREKWRYRGQVRPPFAQPVKDGQESVWDYPRPPRVEADCREVLVTCDEVVLAKTSQALRLLETASPPSFYIPPQAVRVDLLEATAAASLCEWKGRASYWSVALPGRPGIHNVGWSYAEPFDGFVAIAGYFSFYPGRVECYVAGERVEPQPGAVYGGWLTSEVVGPFKGEAGTESW